MRWRMENVRFRSTKYSLPRIWGGVDQTVGADQKGLTKRSVVGKQIMICQALNGESRPWSNLGAWNLDQLPGLNSACLSLVWIGLVKGSPGPGFKSPNHQSKPPSQGRLI